MNDWPAIFESWGVGKGSRREDEYSLIKRKIVKLDLSNVEYERAITAAAKYLKI